MEGKRSEKESERSRVNVYVRCRPLTNSDHCSLSFPNEQELIIGDETHATSYKFDHVFSSSATNLEVCRVVCEPLVSALLSGFNGSFMVYGQTGTGKTHTVLSTDGMISTTFHRLFEIIQNCSNFSYSVKFSYLQIYQDRIYDLLFNSDDGALTLREHPKEGNIGSLIINGPVESFVLDEYFIGVIIEGLSEEEINCPVEAHNLLEYGRKKLIVAETKMVRFSSRSHALCILKLDKKIVQSPKMDVSSGLDEIVKSKSEHIRGKLYLCDLAGSERLKKTRALGKRLDEARYINTSLLELGNVIHALAARNNPHIPFRNSTLTRILKESLGGNSKASLMICISSSLKDVKETKCSLNFGQRAMKVTKHTMANIESRTDSHWLRNPLSKRRKNKEIDYKALSEFLTLKLKELEFAYKLEKDNLRHLKEKTVRRRAAFATEVQEDSSGEPTPTRSIVLNNRLSVIEESAVANDEFTLITTESAVVSDECTPIAKEFAVVIAECTPIASDTDSVINTPLKVALDNSPKAFDKTRHEISTMDRTQAKTDDTQTNRILPEKPCDGTRKFNEKTLVDKNVKETDQISGKDCSKMTANKSTETTTKISFCQHTDQKNNKVITQNEIATQTVMKIVTSGMLDKQEVSSNQMESASETRINHPSYIDCGTNSSKTNIQEMASCNIILQTEINSKIQISQSNSKVTVETQTEIDQKLRTNSFRKTQNSDDEEEKKEDVTSFPTGVITNALISSCQDTVDNAAHLYNHDTPTDTAAQLLNFVSTSATNELNFVECGFVDIDTDFETKQAKILQSPRDIAENFQGRSDYICCTTNEKYEPNTLFREPVTRTKQPPGRLSTSSIDSETEYLYMRDTKHAKKSLRKVKNKYECLLKQFEELTSEKSLIEDELSSTEDELSSTRTCYELVLKFKEKLEDELSQARKQLDVNSSAEKQLNVNNSAEKQLNVNSSAEKQLNVNNSAEKLSKDAASILSEVLNENKHKDEITCPPPLVSSHIPCEQIESAVGSDTQELTDTDDMTDSKPFSSARIEQAVSSQQDQNNLLLKILSSETLSLNQVDVMPKTIQQSEKRARKNAKVSLAAIENVEVKKELLLTKLEKIRLEAVLSCIMMTADSSELTKEFHQLSVNSMKNLTTSRSTLASSASCAQLSTASSTPYQSCFSTPFKKYSYNERFFGADSSKVGSRIPSIRKKDVGPGVTRSVQTDHVMEWLNQDSLAPSLLEASSFTSNTSPYSSEFEVSSMSDIGSPRLLTRLSPYGQDRDDDDQDTRLEKDMEELDNLLLEYRKKDRFSLSCLPFLRKRSRGKKLKKQQDTQSINFSKY